MPDKQQTHEDQPTAKRPRIDAFDRQASLRLGIVADRVFQRGLRDQWEARRAERAAAKQVAASSSSGAAQQVEVAGEMAPSGSKAAASKPAGAPGLMAARSPLDDSDHGSAVADTGEATGDGERDTAEGLMGMLSKMRSARAVTAEAGAASAESGTAGAGAGAGAGTAEAEGVDTGPVGQDGQVGAKRRRAAAAFAVMAAAGAEGTAGKAPASEPAQEPTS